MHRLFPAAFSLLVFLSAAAGAAEHGPHPAPEALPQSTPRSESIETVGKLVFTAGSGFDLEDIEYAKITAAAPGAPPVVERDDAAAARKLKLHLRVAESKVLVRRLEGLTGKRVLVIAPSFASLDSVTHDIDANGNGFSIAEAAEAPAPNPSGACNAAEDCRSGCKGAGKTRECEPDGIPACTSHQCSCELTCL